MRLEVDDDLLRAWLGKRELGPIGPADLLEYLRRAPTGCPPTAAATKARREKLGLFLLAMVLVTVPGRG
jgi:hypothetical protein